uniref:CSON014789 protein n=1 Tax=Culicoides sonorensis TaxID=179676 RepID=A0A336LRZ8_CULSO
MPEKVQIIETKSLEGPTKKHVIKKRVIKKTKGLKQEITEIVTREEENLAPIISVEVTESTIDDSVKPLKPFEEPLTNAQIVEELPETVEITQVETKEGPKKQITKKRVIKKKTGRKQSVTEIVTKQTEGQKPTTSVKVTELDLPLEEAFENIEPFKLKKHKAHETVTEELPEHIQVFETQTLEGPKKKTIIKKRTLKKKKGDKEEITEILTKQDEGQLPETVVTVSEIEAQPQEEVETLEPFKEVPDKAIERKSSIPSETAEEFKPELAELLVEFMKKTAAPSEQKPEDEKITEMVLEDGKPKRKVVKRKVTKKKKISPDEDEVIKRLLELEVSKTPLEDYEKTEYTPKPKPEETIETPVPWQRGPKKEKPVPETPEEKQWPTGKRRPKPEEEKEEITLKPIPKPKKEAEPKPESEDEGPKFKPHEFPDEQPEKEKQKIKKKIKVKKPKHRDGVTIEEVSDDLPDDIIPETDSAAVIIEEQEPLEIVQESPLEETQPMKKKKRPAPLKLDLEEILKPQERVFISEEEVIQDVSEVKRKKKSKQKRVVIREELNTIEYKSDSSPLESEEEEFSKTAVVTLKQPEKVKQVPEPVEHTAVEEEDVVFTKETQIKTKAKVVKKEKKRIHIEDRQPFPELEIITEKRVGQDIVEKYPDENVIDDEVVQELHETQIEEVKALKKKVKETRVQIMPPRFIEKLQPTITEKDKPVLLTCKVEGTPFPDITWFFNDVELFASEQYVMTIIENVATLEIVKATPKDVGIYSCQAKNEGGIATTRTNIIVQEPEETGIAPSFITPLKIEVPEDKDKAKVTCQVHGIPQPIVKWYKEDVEIVNCEETIITYDETTGHTVLEVNNPEKNRPIVYTIEAENKFGRAIGRANVFIQEHLIEKKPEKLKAPKIITPLRAQIVKTGSTLVFDCKYEGLPQPTVKWFKNGKEIKVEEEEEVTIITEEYRSRLEIRNVNRKRTGKYEIVATNKAGEAKSSGSVVVSDTKDEQVKAPRFIKPLTPKIVAEGEVVILEATVESHPTSSFQWFYHQTPIKSSNETRIVTNENKSVLIIESFTRRSSGAYTCRAENVAGSVTSTATVEILEEVHMEEVTEFTSPRFVEKIKPTKVMDGEKLVLSCQVRAVPTPKIQWMHNNLVINEAKHVQLEQDNTGICTLIIPEIFPENAGEYTCVAENKFGKATCKTTVVVDAFEYIPDSEITSQTQEEEDHTLEEEDTLAEFAPKIVKELPKVVETTDKQLTKLEVKVKGQPKPTIKWLKAGEEIIPSEDFQIFNFDDGTSVLVINDVYPDDAGEITFEAYNALGVAVTTTELRVEEIVGTKEYRKPEWVSHMEEMQEALKAAYCVPSFINEVKDTRAMMGEPAKLHCHFQGNPRPDVIWYHNGKACISSENIRILTSEDRSVLQIKKVDVEDFGFYVCKLMSDAGTAESRAKLNQSITATVSTDESASLDIFAKSKGGSDTSGSKTGKVKRTIRVKKQRPTSGDQAENLSKMHSEKETISSFSTTKKEEFATGTLEQTTIINVKTIEDVQIEEMEMTDEQINSKTLKVTDIEKLKHSTEVNNIWNSFKTTELAPFELPLRELATIGFLVKNGITVSEISNLYHESHFPALQTTEAQAALVQLLEREGHAAFVSEVITEESETDEAFVAKTVGFRALMKMIEIEHVNIEEIISHFSPEDFVSQEWKMEQTQETYETKQITSSSATHEVRTVAPPSPPQNLRITDVTSKSVSLEWESPASDGGSDITDYIIEKRLTSSTKWTKVQTLETHYRTYCIDNLKEKSELVFRVMAVNAIGVSAPAITKGVKLKSHATVPTPPTGPLEIRSLGPNVNLVEWGIPESDGGAPLQGYNIAVRDIKKTMWIEVGKVPAGVQRYNIRDLQEDHEYMVRIFARNEIGLSEPLESDEVYKVEIGMGQDAAGEEPKSQLSASFSTQNTSSWMRDNNMDADINTYARHKLIRRDEYFFRVWHYAKKLFK